MRKLGIAVAVVSCACALALFGCASGGQGASSASSAGSSGSASSGSASSGSASSGASAQVGGWTIPESATTAVDADALAIYQEAAKSMDAAIEPVALLGTQVVSGTNYAFLGLGEPGSKAEGWNVVVCYKDLQGKVIPTCTNAVDLLALALAEPASGNSSGAMMGAWEIAVPEQPASLPGDAQAAFDAAMSQYTGMSLTPIALLGKQVVSGMNYMVLCAGAPVTQDPKAVLYVIEVYKDASGNAKITSVDELDFLSYIGN